MSQPLSTERRPLNPIFDSFAPPGRPYRVRDGDTWSSVARAAGIDAGDLIEFNFRTRDPGEINWYLREYVGCVRATPDRRNWTFSSGLAGGRGAWRGGTIWLPRPGTAQTRRITNVRANASGLGASQTLVP
jgi:hypothetical protein